MPLETQTPPNRTVLLGKSVKDMRSERGTASFYVIDRGGIAKRGELKVLDEERPKNQRANKFLTTNSGQTLGYDRRDETTAVGGYMPCDDSF